MYTNNNMNKSKNILKDSYYNLNIRKFMEEIKSMKNIILTER